MIQCFPQLFLHVLVFITQKKGGYDIVITEIKLESDNTHGFTVPFVEIYNPSIDIVLNRIKFSGVVTGNPTADYDDIIFPIVEWLVHI